MNILVLAEHDNNKTNPATYSTLTAALEIAEKGNVLQDCHIDILVSGYNDSSQLTTIVDQLSGMQVANKIIKVHQQELEHQLAEGIAQVIINMASDYDYILMPATTFGKNIAPRVAALLDINPLSDIVAIEAVDIFQRTIYAGNALAKFKLLDKIKLLTVRPTSFASYTNGAGTRTVSTELVEVNSEDNQSNSLARFVQFDCSESERPDLATADIVVSGGRALQSKENFKLIYDLADSLQAAVGASRAAVDAGLVPNDYQVGQTGKVVAPSLYIAVGISGAIQHIAGIQDSKVIVAINKDEEAAIFSVADYGLVGDLFQILPELTDKIKQLKA